MNHETYFIPTNFTNAGRIFGLFETRNMIEALLLSVPILFICIAFLPFSTMAKIIVTMVIVIPVGGFALIGINDDSLSGWVKCWWNWRKSRRMMLFRGEAKIK